MGGCLRNAPAAGTEPWRGDMLRGGDQVWNDAMGRAANRDVLAKFGCQLSDVCQHFARGVDRGVDVGGRVGD